MNFFTKASLTTSIVVSSVFVSAANASAAVFNFTFDNTFDYTVTPPFVGSGTLSFDGTATVGTYSLNSLSNLNMNFSFTDGSSYTIANLDSPIMLSNSGISIFDRGSGNLGLVTTGAVLRFKNSSLQFEPTSNINDPVALFGNDSNAAVVHTYVNNNVGGSYNATAVAPTTPVPEPFTVIGTLVGSTAAFRMRKKLTDRADETNTNG
jgi:hypothetical protein